MGVDKSPIGSGTATRMPPRASWGLVPAGLVSASAVLLFGLQFQLAGYVVLGAALLLAFVINRALFRDLLLIALGLAVLGPYLIARYVYRTHAIRFPIRTGQRWSVLERWYLVIVVILGWLILPTYFIRSGSYENWPAVTAPDEIGRLFVGVGFVGIWDELFFICTVFALLRRHFPDWQANLLQAVIFTSFLWELGYQSWGPLMTFPFALLQGYIFKVTKSLTYVVCVHLLFDLVVFLVIVHAHTREWLPIFLY